MRAVPSRLSRRGPTGDQDRRVAHLVSRSRVVLPSRTGDAIPSYGCRGSTGARSSGRSPGPNACGGLRDRQRADIAADGSWGRRPLRAVPLLETGDARELADAPAVRQHHGVILAASLRQEVHELQLRAPSPGVRELRCPHGRQAVRDWHVALSEERRRLQARSLGGISELDVEPLAPGGITTIAVRDAFERALARVNRWAQDALNIGRASPHLAIGVFLIMALHLLPKDFGPGR